MQINLKNGGLSVSKDLLDMDLINSLPYPLFANLSGTWWPIYDICVQTGLIRLDVCGLLEVTSIGSLQKIRDGSGKEHFTDDFYIEEG